MQQEAARTPDSAWDEWQSPSRRASAPALAEDAQPLVLVAEETAVLTPMVAELCAFLRVRAEQVAPSMLGNALRLRMPVGVLCHAARTDRAVAQVLRAVIGADPGLPVMVVTEQDPSRAARLAVAPEIIRLDHLIWLEHLPDLRRMVDFLSLAERRAGRGGLMPV